MISIFLHLESQHGERTFDHKSVHLLPNGTNIEKWCDKYVSDYWGEEGEKEGDWYSFACGDVATRVYNVLEITKDQYKVLSQFL